MMHVGTIDSEGEETASKPECVFLPQPNFFKPTPMLANASDTEATALVTKPKSESAAARAEREGAA
jgi:hypothetical protein